MHDIQNGSRDLLHDAALDSSKMSVSPALIECCLQTSYLVWRNFILAQKQESKPREDRLSQYETRLGKLLGGCECVFVCLRLVEADVDHERDIEPLD